MGEIGSASFYEDMSRLSEGPEDLADRPVPMIPQVGMNPIF